MLNIFLDSNNIKIATSISAKTQPKIYQNMQNLYSDFLNIFKNNVLLKYYNIKKSIPLMIKFSKMINDTSILDNHEDQFFENLGISDLKEEFQAIDSLRDSELVNIISPQESNSFNNHSDESIKQINIVLTRLLNMAEINIFKINSISTFIKENYPVTNQNYQQQAQEVDISKYLKKLNEKISEKQNLTYTYTFELKIENEFKMLINKLNDLSKNKKVIGIIFLKIIEQVQKLFKQYCKNLNGINEIDYKQELINDIEEKLEVTKQILTTKIIKYFQILLLITEGKFRDIKPLELYHKINLLLFYQKIQDFLLAENQNITNNNILTSILFEIKVNDNENNTEIGQNIKILQASVVDYSMIVKNIEKSNEEKNYIETIIKKITKAIKEINIEFTAINNVIEKYESNFSILQQKNNDEIIILQRQIEEVKEQIKTEQENIKDLEINNKEQEIAISLYSHSENQIKNKKV